MQWMTEFVVAGTARRDDRPVVAGQEAWLPHALGNDDGAEPFDVSSPGAGEGGEGQLTRASYVRRFCRRQRRGGKISDQRITQGRLTLIAAEELYAFRVTRRLNPLCRSDTCTGGERDRGQAGVH